MDTENPSACTCVPSVAQQILPLRNYRLDIPSLWVSIRLWKLDGFLCCPLQDRFIAKTTIVDGLLGT